MTTYVIGDLHGHLNSYQRLLSDSGLADETGQWTGKQDNLWLIGDFFDRGPDGIGCLDLTIRLQQQAEAAGGSVRALLGNHELMILTAYRFAGHEVSRGVVVEETWQRWGGVAQDLARFSEQHAKFIESLPAMAVVEDHLLIHADATLYVNHGITIESVNDSFRGLLEQPDLKRMMLSLDAFAEHMAFCGPSNGPHLAEQMLKMFGGRKIVHGHTPIPIARQDNPAGVTTAWEYANGLCVNVDGGIYMGSPGFVYSLAS